MKILILGTFVEGSLENFYYEGLIKAGQEVTKIECSVEYYNVINRNIFNKIINNFNSDILLKSFNLKINKDLSNKYFDVIIVFKGMTLFPETIFSLKKNCKLLINYNPDHPLKYYSKGSGNKNVKNSLQFYDMILTYSEKIKCTLINNHNITSEVLPFGYNMLSKNIQPIKNRKSIKFIGSFDLERFEKLNSIKIDRLEIFGDNKWMKFNSIKGKSEFYNNRKIYGDDFIKEIQSSLSIINILREQNTIENSHNMRTFEVPALGGVLLSDYTEEQASFFEPDKEMLYFKNIEELNSKIEYLTKSPNSIELISKNAFLRSQKSNYSYYHRSLDLINIIKLYI